MYTAVWSTAKSVHLQSPPDGMLMLGMSDGVFAFYRNSLNKDNKTFLKCI